MGQNVLITGATGMIGGMVLKHCLHSNRVDRVVSLVRKASSVKHPKLQEVIVEDFLNLTPYENYLMDIDVVFYCQGVYTGAVDRETFRKITVDYPEALGKQLKKHNSQLRFCLLSGAGADRKEKSRMMFAKDKGAVENRLSKMQFDAFHSFRPGYIYPVVPRNEPNFSYRLMRWLYPLIKALGKGTSIKSTELALAMFKVGMGSHDLEMLENKDILNFVESYR